MFLHRIMRGKVFRDAKKSSATKLALQKRAFSHKHVLEAFVTPKSQSVNTLHRNVPLRDKHAFFHPRAALVGLPSRKASRQAMIVSSNEIIAHKMSVLSSDYYISTSVLREYSEKFGTLSFTIDASHPHQWVDAEHTYLVGTGQYAEHQEYEYITLAVLNAALQSVVDPALNKGKGILNPFYLPINSDHEIVVSQYQSVYLRLCEILLKSHCSDHHAAHEKMSMIKDYTHELIKLYQLVLGKDSPFNLTRSQFRKKFPEFSKEMRSCDELTPSVSASSSVLTWCKEAFLFSPQKEETLAEIYQRECVSLFVTSPYLPRKML